jgi:hypothetical protein
MYIEQRYCMDCVCIHWLEILPNGREVCHGERLRPADSLTHYTRRSGRGFELVEKYIPANLALINAENQIKQG